MLGKPPGSDPSCLGRSRFVGVAALALLTAGPAWARKDEPTDPLAAQQEAAAEEGPDQVLEQLRLSSMARARGDDALAEQALRRAVAGMTDFQADGEFAAMVGAEQRKDYKGEPYEKLAAFTDLGVLLYGKGDRGNALAMFKSAVLADTGTREERYRSDYVPAWVFEALAFQAEGEADNAAQAMQRAVDSRWSRQLLDLLTRSLSAVQVEGDPGAVNCARALLLSSMSGGVTASPRDPGGAVRATLSIATELRLEQSQLHKRDRLPALQSFSKRDFASAVEVMDDLAARWAETARELPPDAVAQVSGFEQRMNALLADEPNVVLLVERGSGPTKIRGGKYGEILQIAPGRAPPPPTVDVDGQAFRPVWLDSLSFQATTRGGRAVDGYLKGKAVFKDTSFITGYVLWELADAAAHSDNDQLALAFAAAGCCLMITGAVTNPAADVRQWDEIPEEYWLVAGSWPAGVRELVVDGRSRKFVVPERGQLVVAIPAGRGGADVLGDATGVDLDAPPRVRLAEPPDEPDAPLAVPVQSP